MKSFHKVFLILVITSAIFSGHKLAYSADEKGGDGIGAKPVPAAVEEAKRGELTKEVIDRVMARLREADPKKADAMEKLRQKDPQEFKQELRNIMHQFRQRTQDGGPEVPAGEPPRGHGREVEQVEPGMAASIMEKMIEKEAEYIGWLEKNYPDEAEKLAKIKKEAPGLYLRQFTLSMKKNAGVYQAWKQNPELGEVVKQDIELRQKLNELVKKVKAAQSDEQKQELTKQVTDILNSRYDLLVKQQQIRYQILLKKLDELKAEAKEKEAQVEKWKDPKYKEENVKARLMKCSRVRVSLSGNDMMRPLAETKFKQIKVKKFEKQSEIT